VAPVVTLVHPLEAIPPLAELFALVVALAVFPTQAPVVVVLVAVLVVPLGLALESPVKETMVVLRHHQ
jgi:hypothetical protein